MKTTWYEHYPERYQNEIDALSTLGIVVSEDASMREQGLLRFRLSIAGTNSHFDFPDKQQAYELIVVFPDSYPWFRPEVYAYGLDLPRHQHLRGKNLCLLPRGTGHWDPTETVANLLVEQLPLVLEKGMVTDREIVKADEMEQAEPYSEYYNVQFNSPVLFDPENINVKYKPADFREIGRIKVGFPERADLPSRMAVLETFVPKTTLVHRVNSEVAKMFSNKIVEGILIETPEHPPAFEDAREVMNWLKKGILKTGEKLTPPNSNVKIGHGIVSYVIGICFPEEVEKGVAGMGWVFLVAGSFREREDKKAKPGFYLAKPAFIGSDAIQDRVPRLSPLSNKTVSIIGLGALGSFTAIELARCGVKELRILDFDSVDPPTTVRWPLGIKAAGLEKTVVLQNFIKENYPRTNVVVLRHRLGSVRIQGNSSKADSDVTDQQIINEFLNATDLLLDATAEEGINHFLSRIAVRRKLKHVVIYATPGAWGGLVMRWMPDETEGCWTCMKNWQKDDEENLVPPVDHQGMIQPPGCGDLTFTGASFDLQQISLAAVRMAVSMLCASYGGYSLLPWDWAVLSLVDHQGAPIVPTWHEQKLLCHPNCSYCAKQ